MNAIQYFDWGNGEFYQKLKSNNLIYFKASNENGKDGFAYNGSFIVNEKRYEIIIKNSIDNLSVFTFSFQRKLKVIKIKKGASFISHFSDTSYDTIFYLNDFKNNFINNNPLTITMDVEEENKIVSIKIFITTKYRTEK